ncbi:MAG: hypothetical protein ABF649_16380, partial [Bacillus sp. (in: firmicutes)]
RDLLEPYRGQRQMCISYRYNNILKAYDRFYEDKKIYKKTIERKKHAEWKEILQKQTKPKKIHTAEQLRERNIGFLLYIGVLLLLIGGLFVATSNWDTMAGWMKACSTFFVSFLFYGFAVFAKRIVKIEKTAFAFFVLGSFFLPIGILSVSWFELLGHFLSFRGEGNFLLGVLGSLLLIPIYYYLANLLHSRFFRVVTLVTISCMTAFLLLSFHFTKDLFFFCFIAYNCCLLLILSKWKEKYLVKKFNKEMPIYTQIHLILTTICLLFFYNGAVFQGINFLLLSALYIGILFETKYKQYHVFVTLMVVIGSYRIFTTDLFYNWSPVLLAVVALCIMVFGSVISKVIEWGRVWEITSIVVIALTFLYSQLYNTELIFKGSVMLPITYLLIACQFIYLANRSTYRIYTYLPAVFIGLSFWQFALKMNIVDSIKLALITIYSIGIILLFLLGFCNQLPVLKKIKYSSATFGLAIMMVVAYYSGIFYFGDWFVGCLFLLLTASFILVKKARWPVFYLAALRYLIPFCLAAAYLAFSQSIIFFESKGISFNLAISSVLLLASTFFFKKDVVLKQTSFYIGQGIYILAIFLSIIFPLFGEWTRTGIYAVGLFVFIQFYKVRKKELIVWLISIVAVMTYLALISDLFAYSSIIQWKFHLYGWLVLFALQWVLKEHDFKRTFFILGHLYLLLSISIDYTVNGREMHLHFLYALCMYIISVIIVKNKWGIIVFQYASYSSFFLFIANTLSAEFAGGDSFSQAFLFTSILLFLVYILLHKVAKKAIIYFFIPFSLIGISCWMITSVFSTSTYIVLLIYLAIYFIFTYVSKMHYFSIAGLIQLVASTELFIYSTNIMEIDQFLLYSVIGVLLVFIGSFAYNTIYYFAGKIEGSYLDFYSLTGILVFAYLYAIHLDSVWAKVLPGIFIAVTLFIQKRRVPQKIAWLPVLGAVIYLLQPYYSVIDQLPIPLYFSKESIVLPWLLLVIISKKIVAKTYMPIINRIEWGVLILVASLLIMDALQTSTIMDALIIGSLSVLSVISGFYFKYKSYFFVGVTVLLLNVMLQTKSYWGSFPWWAYLLIAGSILILVASFYEMQKQKSDKKMVLKIVKWKNHIKNTLAKWQ